jgi:hypothetical protein
MSSISRRRCSRLEQLRTQKHWLRGSTRTSGTRPPVSAGAPVHRVLVGTGTQRVHVDFGVYLDEFVKARVHVGAQRRRQVVVQQLLVHLRVILASDLESGIVPLRECRRLFQTSLM